jgi:tryptophan synthase alpha chain
MNPIDSLFAKHRAAKRPAFMPFLPAGDPDLAFTEELLGTVAANGADLIEVGFPFSDPIADGPIIQASYTRALNAKLKIPDVFTALGRAKHGVPMVGMVSYSLIFKMGLEAFLKAAQAANLSGVVVPDLPAEEAEELSKRCKDRDFKLILLVAPTTTPKRAEIVVKACSGFVYVVSVVGITGERAMVFQPARELVKRLRSITDLPLCVGFGISKPEHVKEVGEFADGAIVGSALVKLLDGAGTNRAKALEAVRAKVKELSGV